MQRLGDWAMPVLNFVTLRTKPLCEVTARDVPPGLDPDDVTMDCPRTFGRKCPKKRNKCAFRKGIS